MPLEWSSESNYMKELTKWNTPRRNGGFGPNGHEEFPRMLYKAQRHPMSNKWEVALPRDVISADRTVVVLDAEQFNATCQKTVRNQEEYDRALADGYRKTHAEALDYAEGREQEKAVEAAVRAFEDSKLSEKAQAEAAVREGTGGEHVPEIKALPTKRFVSEATKQKQRDAWARRRAAK